LKYRSISRRVGNAVRLAEVAQVLVRHGFPDLLRLLGLYEGAPAKVLRRLRLVRDIETRPHTVGDRLRAALTELGPTFIKFGQVLSTRPDLVGPDIAKALESLQDQVDPLPFEAMRPVVEGALGAPIEGKFAQFNPTPVAAASLSQVYRAVLPTGEPVAVKVMRPGVVDRVVQDISLLRSLADWAADRWRDAGWIDPRATVEEFSRSMRRELDFGIEADIIQRFHANYRDHPHVVVPRVYKEWSAPHVLTMDWVDGVRIDALDEYPARNCDPRTVARIGAEALCDQVFVFRLFHADPHPGNVLVTRDNRITFLDYGMTGHLDADDVSAMARLLHAIARDDTTGVVKALLRFTTTAHVEQLEPLRHEVADYLAFEVKSIVSGGLVGKALERIPSLLRNHGLQLAPRFSLLLKALGTIERTGHLLDPALDTTPIMQPYVERVVRQRYAPGHLAREAGTQLEALAEVAAEFPEELAGLVYTLRGGHLKIQLQHEKLNHLAAVIDRASNRIAFGVISGSIIVGSSLLLAANVGWRGMGLAGYTIAGILGLWLAVSILRSRNL